MYGVTWRESCLIDEYRTSCGDEFLMSEEEIMAEEEREKEEEALAWECLHEAIYEKCANCKHFELVRERWENCLFHNIELEPDSEELIRSCKNWEERHESY